MKIDSVTAYVFQIPLKTPFRCSAGEIRVIDGILFACRSGDFVGWGEAAVDEVPCYAHETVGSVLDIARKVLAPQMMSRDFAGAQELVDLFDTHRGNRFAKAALEAAFWNLLGQVRGTPVARLLGGVRTEAESGPSIGIKPTPEQTVATVAEQLAQGRRRIKIKVAPGRDTAYIRAVREAFPDITLMVDANNAYTPADFDHLAEWDAFNLLMIEQPLDEGDIYFHSQLKKRIKTPVCLDESIHTLHDTQVAIALGACDIINIKICRVGGLCHARKIHDACQKAGITNWIGSRVGTGVAVAARLASASWPNCSLPTDAGLCSMYMADDLTTAPYPVHDGCMVQVPDTPGMGFQIDMEKLKRYTVWGGEL